MTEQEITIEYLDIKRRAAVDVVQSADGNPSGTGVWAISQPVLNQIVKAFGAPEWGGLCVPAIRDNELTRLFGSDVVPLPTDAHIFDFHLWCSFCGHWLTVDSDARCKHCGERMHF